MPILRKIKDFISHPFRKGAGDGSSESRGDWTWRSVLKKILLVITSLLLAMLLWGYVLMAQNPDRTKTYTGIPVKLESGSEADLLYKNLMVYGNIAEILSDVSVTVKAPLTDITKITANDITATVSFNDVHGSGISRLQVRAVCANNGTVMEVDPAYIEVDVDDITTRNISVDQTFTGELPEGYWHGSATISPKTVTVKGPKRQIEQISTAVCEIDLSELTESVNHSFTLKLTDDEGNEFDQDVLLESIPSVNVQMQVLPYKEIEIIYTYGDSLRSGLTIADERLDISSINIASDSNALQKLTAIMTDKVYLGNIDLPGVYEFNLSLTGIPDDAVIIDNPNLRSVKLTLVIEETYTEATIEGITLTVTGRADGLKYSYYAYGSNGELGEALVRLALDVIIKGDQSAVEAVSPGDIVLMIDITGLGVGEHDVPVRLAWSASLGALDDIEYTRTLHVVIEPANE